jgi:hypothetical protein
MTAAVPGAARPGCAGLGSRPMPLLWKAGMVVLVVCLVAAMAIAIVRLATTPNEILGDGFRGLPVHSHRAPR